MELKRKRIVKRGRLDLGIIYEVRPKVEAPVSILDRIVRVPRLAGFLRREVGSYILPGLWGC